MEEKLLNKGNLTHSDYVLALRNTTGYSVLVHSCMVLGLSQILEFKGEIFNCIGTDSFCELVWELRVQSLILEVSVKHR